MVMYNIGMRVDHKEGLRRNLVVFWFLIHVCNFMLSEKVLCF